MSRRLFIGVFEDEAHVLAATREARMRGYRIADVYTPYAVHGLDDAMVLRRTRLPWISLGFGLLGAIWKVWFEFWTTSIDWPINVGGKPWNSLVAFIPITFEVMVYSKSKRPVADRQLVTFLVLARKVTQRNRPQFAAATRFPRSAASKRGCATRPGEAHKPCLTAELGQCSPKSPPACA